MAASDQIRAQASIATKSYDTALCIIPPQHLCEEIDRLRSRYDKAYGKWPPHINLIYPFVALEHLSQAKELIETHSRTARADAGRVTIAFGGAGIFRHKKDTTIYLQENDDKEAGVLGSLRSGILQALGQKSSPHVFHLTIGQAQDNSVLSRQFLVDKVNLLPAFEYDVSSLAILIREKTTSKTDAGSQMRLWGTIDLPIAHKRPREPLKEFWVSDSLSSDEAQATANEANPMCASSSVSNRQVKRGTTYMFYEEAREWRVSTGIPEETRSETLSVSSYNVLLDSEYPPSHDRDPLLVDTILRESALADVLVLQEVSDEFLIFLLQDEKVRETYPFTSHGPPSQADIGPLPSLRNIVILSKRHFDWDSLPFHRRHKGAIVASFPSFLSGTHANAGTLVVAGVHLTAGLTDGSVAAKKVQLQKLISHLRLTYPTESWIVAGDFNLPTSTCTVDQAVKHKDISLETSRLLTSTEGMLYEAGLVDAWTAARVEGIDDTAALDTDDLGEGEEGATFNPRGNPLAAYISGTADNRPQRYDRIFIRSQGKLALKKFNQFGLPEQVNNDVSVASDHYGVRAMFNVQKDTGNKFASDPDILKQRVVLPQSVSPELALTTELMEVLSKRTVFPTDEDENHYEQAYELIKDVLIGADEDGSHASDIPLVVVPVGSYALNVWTPGSDVDCLCIGTISSRTFFHLARQRIRKAESKGVRLLRMVQATTGIMLELSVNGVDVDLQYCPAANIVQRWSEFSTLPATDPIFNLPILSLRKLKPLRDLAYIQRTIPSMASFRLAYHLIKRWAMDRGIYSAKFGYFGGIHIALMLSWICKCLAHDTSSVSAADLILSFFHYYAHFDWANDLVYDAFFHKKKPRYQRSTREPMVILGFHAPNSNIAHTATAPGAQVLVSNLKQAYESLSTPGITWEEFLDVDVPAVGDFLMSFESYVRIDIQYWGRALSRGKGLVEWVESRCINLVVEINKALPHSLVRIWPARFADAESIGTESYYHGSYLIGLSRAESSSPLSREEKVEAKATLQEIFDRFLTQVRADDKYYDESSAWIGISVVKSSELKGLQLDSRQWGDYLPDLDPDSDLEDDFDELEDDTPPSTLQNLPIRPNPSGTTTPVSSKKLRPASDILNRLRWDSNLDPSDYTVGYEDRFLGAKELSLEKWKTEQTDEEFIPQHRILYFKKKGDEGGEVVWERATRVDKVFGSGLGDGAA